MDLFAKWHLKLPELNIIYVVCCESELTKKMEFLATPLYGVIKLGSCALLEHQICI